MTEDIKRLLQQIEKLAAERNRLARLLNSVAFDLRTGRASKDDAVRRIDEEVGQ